MTSKNVSIFDVMLYSKSKGIQVICINLMDKDGFYQLLAQKFAAKISYLPLTNNQ